MIGPKKLARDTNLRAHQVARLLTGEGKPEPPEPERSAVSVYLAKIGREGGLKGGKARAAKLSRREKKQIAKKAARVRWGADPGHHPHGRVRARVFKHQSDRQGTEPPQRHGHQAVEALRC